MKRVRPSKHFSGRGCGGRGLGWVGACLDWLIGPLWARHGQNSPASFCTRRAARCKSNLPLGIFEQGLSSLELTSIFEIPFPLTLFPCIKNLPASWDGCRIFAVHRSPRATWAVQCRAGCRQAVRHTAVQLLDCHITTGCRRGGLLTVYALNWAWSLCIFTQRRW